MVNSLQKSFVLKNIVQRTVAFKFSETAKTALPRERLNIAAEFTHHNSERCWG